MAKLNAIDLKFRSKIPNIKPLYAVDLDDDDEILEWFRTCKTTLDTYYQPLFNEQIKNLQLFLNAGLSPKFASPEAAIYFQQGMVFDVDQSNVWINELYLLIMEQVSTIVSNELTSQVLPNNDDYSDKVAAKFVKAWLDSMSYDLDIDMSRIRWEMQKKIFGECFVIPVWDEQKGDIHPEAKGLLEDQIELLDNDGKPVKNENGETIQISKWQRIGDIDLKNPMPFDVALDPQMSFSRCNWFWWTEYVENEYLKREYPGVDIDTDESTKYDSNSGLYSKTGDMTKVYHLTHRSHPFLPLGKKIIFTENTILHKQSLEDTPTLIDSRELPIIRFSDLDTGIGVRGIPILPRNTSPLINAYNQVTSQMLDNTKVESPKLMVHEESDLNAQELPYGVIACEWRGSIKPTWDIPTSNNNSIFKFREDLRKNIIELAQQNVLVRGETPNAQLDSFIALQHFEDQRVQLAAPDIKGHIKAIEKLYRMMIVIARDHYDEEDQRLIKIVGRNNKFSLKYFEPENLNKVYDVKITTTGNLANSKAARTQLTVMLKREFPDLISDERFVDLLGLSHLEKFQNAVTAAVNSAESENEDMLNGVDIDPPERYEDLITHWDIHRTPMQGREFKMAPQHIRDLFERHVTATEKLMFEQAAEDQMFASRLAQLRQFPLFYSAAPPMESPQQEQQIVETAQPPADEIIDVDKDQPEATPEQVDYSSALPQNV